jgi:hypothetical protein
LQLVESLKSNSVFVELNKSDHGKTLVAFTPPKKATISKAIPNISDPKTLFIHGKNRKFEASILGTVASYLIYIDATTAWSVTAIKGNKKLEPSDWAKNSYVYKKLEEQIQHAEVKHKSNSDFMTELSKKWQKQHPRSNDSSGEQVKPQNASHKNPAQANWLQQAWLGYSENAARAYVGVREFLGADAKWVAEKNNNIARNLYYKGADVHSPAFGVGKAINNIGTGALIAEGAIALAPESVLMSVGRFLMRPAIRAGAPVAAVLQTANGVKNKDAEQTTYGVAGGLSLFMKSLLGRFHTIKSQPAGSIVRVSNDALIRDGLKKIRDLPPKDIEAFAITINRIDLTPHIHKKEFPEFIQLCLKKLNNYRFMPNVKAAFAKLEKLGTLEQTGGAIVLVKPSSSALVPTKPKAPRTADGISPLAFAQTQLLNLAQQNGGMFGFNPRMSGGNVTYGYPRPNDLQTQNIQDVLNTNIVNATDVGKILGNGEFKIVCESKNDPNIVFGIPVGQGSLSIAYLQLMQEEVRILHYLEKNNIPTIKNSYVASFNDSTGIFGVKGQIKYITVMDKLNDPVNTKDLWDFPKNKWDERINNQTVLDLIKIKNGLKKSKTTVRDLQLAFTKDGRVVVIDPDGMSTSQFSERQIFLLDEMIEKVQNDLKRIEFQGKNTSTDYMRYDWN